MLLEQLNCVLHLRNVYYLKISHFIFTGKCYQIFYSYKTWAEAEFTCEHYGGHLASITSQPKRDFITSQLTYNYVWIGGNDIVSEQTWKWNNGDNWDYTSWSSGSYPVYDKTDNCLRMSQDGSWHDNSCCSSYPYVCEIPDPDIAQQTSQSSASQQINIASQQMSTGKDTQQSAQSSTSQQANGAKDTPKSAKPGVNSQQAQVAKYTQPKTVLQDMLSSTLTK